MSTLPDTNVQRLKALEEDRNHWLYNAQQLQKQVNGWEPERLALKAALRQLCFAASNCQPMLDTNARRMAARDLETALGAAEKLL